MVFLLSHFCRKTKAAVPCTGNGRIRFGMAFATPYDGIIRIRFNGFRIAPISAIRSPVSLFVPLFYPIRPDLSKLIYIRASCLMAKTHRKMVTIEKREPNTTSCPASSASPPICWAMVKKATADGQGQVKQAVR